jgi:hypothetical protein
MNQTTYDLADFGAIANDPDADIADAFRSVFRDMDANDPGGGAQIVVPPGDYYLNTTLVIDRDFITIEGVNYGWRTGTNNAGGSRLIVRSATGISVPVSGQRTRSLVLRNLALDGEAVSNGRIAVDIQNDNDGVVIEGIAVKEFQEAVVIRNADAAYIVGNLIAENDSCVRFVNSGIANIVADNRLGAKPGQITLFAENQDRMVIAGNNLFPDGYSNVVLKTCTHCAVSGNQFQSFYTGMLYLEGSGCSYNTVTGNTFVSQPAPSGQWNVNSRQQFPDDFGIIRIEGNHNVVTGNNVDSFGTTDHVMVRLVGDGNHLSDCILHARSATTRKVQVDGGTMAAPVIVLDSTTAAETQFSTSSVRRFREFPAVQMG